MQGLGSLGRRKYGSEATSVSADGSVIVGSATTDDGEEAFRWTEDAGMQSLGDIDGYVEAGAMGVSADGSVIVGFGTEAGA
jgi:probable HAF family extracellular repeat protein